MHADLSSSGALCSLSISSFSSPPRIKKVWDRVFGVGKIPIEWAIINLSANISLVQMIFLKYLFG